MDALVLGLWRFVRGDTTPRVFEAWLYSTDELEERLGPVIYEDAISTDFRSRDKVYVLRKRLGAFLTSATVRDCECVTLPHLAVVDMGEHEHVFASLLTVEKRGDPYWWLSLDRCNVCEEFWLVAQEERQNDVFCLRRLDSLEAEAVLETGQWPGDFNQYEQLLRIGQAAGRTADFVDPMHSSLRFTIEDLARARPGIRIMEIADLLNLELALATTLARALPVGVQRLIDFS